MMWFYCKRTSISSISTYIRKLLPTFKNFIVEHVGRQENKYGDALVTLGAKINLVEEITQVTILQKTKLVILEKEFKHEATINETDCCTTIIKVINDPKKSLYLKQAKDYCLILGAFSKHMTGGILMKYVHEQEGEKLLNEKHEVSGATKPKVSLYRKIQRTGYYWPDMKNKHMPCSHLAPSAKT